MADWADAIERAVDRPALLAEVLEVHSAVNVCTKWQGSASLWPPVQDVGDRVEAEPTSTRSSRVDALRGQASRWRSRGVRSADCVVSQNDPPGYDWSWARSVTTTRGSGSFGVRRSICHVVAREGYTAVSVASSPRRKGPLRRADNDCEGASMSRPHRAPSWWTICIHLLALPPAFNYSLSPGTSTATYVRGSM